MQVNQIYKMDCIKGMNEVVDPSSVDIIITSPPKVKRFIIQAKEREIAAEKEKLGIK